jgi:hypothetical protein
MPIVIGIVNAPQIRAQAQDTVPLKFEVATIKPSKNGGGKGGPEILPGGGLRIGGVTLRNLITSTFRRIGSLVDRVGSHPKPTT